MGIPMTDGVSMTWSMRTVTDTMAIADTVKDTCEQGRRVMAKGRQAAEEDGMATAVVNMRRRPPGVVATVTAAAAVVGCMVGFAFGRCTRR